MSEKVFITPRYYVFASDEGVSSSDTQEKTPSDGDSSVRNEKVVSSTSVSSDQNLIDQVTLTNHLLVGIILFIGVFFGAFCMAHLYNRIRRD